MRILVVGTGYVGLVAAACFAEMGHSVLSLDIDQGKIDGLRKGIIPIYEPGLEEIVRRNVLEKRLSFTTSYDEGVDFAEIIFLGLPTPSLSNGEADLSFVRSGVQTIAEKMQRPLVIVNKSTVPPGTTRDLETLIEGILSKRGCSIAFEVVFNPEFLKEGDAINDFMKPDRIVIGTKSERALSTLKELYAPFNLSHERMIVMDSTSAEMTKYAANSLLASRISFMNEVAGICERLGADITLIRKGIGSDRRIGYDFLYAGVGFGGSCFPKDIRALAALAKKEEIDTPLLNAIEIANERQKNRMSEKILEYYRERGESLRDKRMAIWGLSFKPGTDDLREAPSLVLIKFLLENGVYLRLYDPIAMKKARHLFKPTPQIHFAENEYEAAANADAIILMTEWKQFRFVDFGKIGPKMASSVLFDGRNQYAPHEMSKLGFDYISIGRPDLCKSHSS